MQAPLWTWMIPAITLMGTSWWTRRSIPSLAFSLFIGCLLASITQNSSMFQVFQNAISSALGLTAFSTSNKTDVFITMSLLAFFIQILQHSGLATAFAQTAKHHFQSQRSAQMATSRFSFFFCMDDYFSILTNGAIFRPIFDNMRIPRTQLAWILDSLASPVVALCPFSSWSPVLLSFLIDCQLQRFHITTTSAYFSMLSWNLYSLTIIPLVLFCAHHTDATPQSISTENISSITKKKTQAFCIAFSIVVLSSWSYIVINGELLQHGSWILALQKTSMSKALQCGFLCGLCFILSHHQYYHPSQKIIAPSLSKAWLQAFPTTCTLLLAWTLGRIMGNDLYMGDFFSELLKSFNPSWAPGLFFFSSLFISMTTGSAWASMALLYPVAADSIWTQQATEWLAPTLGSILAGSLTGDHLSPISDTTMLAAKVSQCSLHEHIQTQFQKTKTALLTTTSSYLILGFSTTPPHALLVACIAIPTTLLLTGRVSLQNSNRDTRDNRQKKRPHPTPQTQQPAPGYKV